MRLKVNKEEVFIKALKSKKLPAFMEFYDHYAPAFYGDIKKMVPAEQPAADALTNGFLRIWNSIESYEPAREQLFTWSLKIMRAEASKKKIDLVLNELFACRQKYGQAAVS